MPHMDVHDRGHQCCESTLQNYLYFIKSYGRTVKIVHFLRYVFYKFTNSFKMLSYNFISLKCKFQESLMHSWNCPTAITAVFVVKRNPTSLVPTPILPPLPASWSQHNPIYTLSLWTQVFWLFYSDEIRSCDF